MMDFATRKCPTVQHTLEIFVVFVRNHTNWKTTDVSLRVEYYAQRSNFNEFQGSLRSQ